MSVETLQQNTWLLNCSTDKWPCVHVKLGVSLFPCTGWYNPMDAYSIMMLIFILASKTSPLLAQLPCKRACLKAAKIGHDLELPSSKLSVGSYKVQGCSF